jgi:ketosteroid isomerase-like protein
MENKATTSARKVSSPTACIRGIQRAINQHDLNALTECFDADYQSEFPTHLGRAFRGHSQLRTNWSQIFGSVPGIQAELLRSAEHGDTVWAEWEWQGTRVDGAPFLLRGVTIQEVRDGRVVWVRLYMEPVEAAGSATDAEAALNLVGERPREASPGSAAVQGGEQ